MRRCWMPLLKRKARPSASTRHTVAPTRRGEPSRGMILRRTDVPVLSPLVGPDFGTEGTDVERSRQEAARSGVNDDAPGDAGARVLPPLLLPGISMREEISNPMPPEVCQSWPCDCVSTTRAVFGFHVTRHHESDTGPAPEADSLTGFWISV